VLHPDPRVARTCILAGERGARLARPAAEIDAVARRIARGASMPAFIVRFVIARRNG
jgi:hypothetical protein